MINVYAAIKHSVNLRYLHTPETIPADSETQRGAFVTNWVNPGPQHRVVSNQVYDINQSSLNSGKQLSFQQMLASGVVSVAKLCRLNSRAA